VTPRTLAIAYLFLQAVAGLAWWVGIFTSPALRAYFVAPDAPDITLTAFIGADSLLFVGGSIVSAILLHREHPKRGGVLWFTAGAVAYAALYALGLSVLTNAVWLGSVPMLGAMVITIVIAWRCP